MNPGFQVGALVWVGLLTMRDPSLVHLAAPSRFLGPSNFPVLNVVPSVTQCPWILLEKPHPIAALPPLIKLQCIGYQNPINSKPFNFTQCDRLLLLFPSVRCGHGLREVKLHAKASQLTEEELCVEPESV